jgi:hypothetical protein
MACNANTCGGTKKEVAAANCNAGTCQIDACIGSWQDTDGQCSDGCECALSTVSTTCGSGAYSLGTLPVNAPPSSHTSNLFPASPNAAYYVVTFTGETFTTFHPRITLTDPLNEFVMDVTTDCSTLESSQGSTTCNTTGDAGSSRGITSWDASYIGGDPTFYPVTGSHFAPISVDAGGTLYIKVYRKGAVSSCNNAYTITVSA